MTGVFQMKVFNTVERMRNFSMSCKLEGKKVGVVPTMGFLHEGHLSLVKKIQKTCDICVLTIFVNPTQFAPDEDFEDYPRDLKKDLKRCELCGVDAVFTPSEEEMYPSDSSTRVVEHELSNGKLCAVSRPEHFRGVTTIVAKLFNSVLPDYAVFGRKDYQQLQIIKRMVRDLNFPLKIIEGEIIREKDGLAMSSRNRYLSDEERMRALSINKSLKVAERDIRYEYIRNPDIIIGKIRKNLNSAGLEIDYVEVLNSENLEKVDKISEKVLIAVAAGIGKTRLIDNILVSP